MKQILWAPDEFEQDLLNELNRNSAEILFQQKQFFIVESGKTDWVWVDSIGKNAELITFDSISKARETLKSKGKLWSPQPVTHFRRSELIAEELLQPKEKLRKFREPTPKGTLGAFSLINENQMWVSPELTPAVPVKGWKFEETKEAPSRAYLKLWELFTREGFAPKKGERCLELGSAPGGWTWVLDQLGAETIAVDKGEMDPRVLKSSRVQWLRKDAFSIKVDEIGKVDWLFSDLICYPQRLLELVKEWDSKGWARNFVCTIKFQGETDFEAMDAFLRLPGSKAIHLHHNKHEVTWWRVQGS